MASLHSTASWALALIGLTMLAGCERAASPTAANAPAAPPASATDSASVPSSMAGIAPHVEDISASGSKGTGPSEGSTAIGGVVGNQDNGGANKGGMPAPTGGDGAAASAPK